MKPRLTLYHNTEAMIQHVPPEDVAAFECPERLIAVEAALRQGGDASVWSQCASVCVTDPLPMETVREEYGRGMQRLLETPYEEPTLDETSPDIYWSKGSSWAARIAAATAVQAVRDVLADKTQNAFCLVRPPGHHCFDIPEGFCILNNVALAAQEALRAGKKVAIVDWDYHFGDGTAKTFMDESRVLFVSLHAAMSQRGYPTYPRNNRQNWKGAGLAHKTRGRMFNIQWHQDDADDPAYAYAFRRVILPAIQAFGADLVLISAGFDAVKGDALAGMEVSPEAFGHMAYMLADLGLPCVAVLEGGYDTTLLAKCCVQTAWGLKGHPAYMYWTTSTPYPRHKEVVDQVANIIGLQ